MIAATCSSVIVVISLMPRDAAITDTRVDAIPLVVKTALYGAASPARAAVSSTDQEGQVTSQDLLTAEGEALAGVYSVAKWTSS